ncbi:glycoside hydrolase family 1 protein [Candidatus Falkowbacteria bacterium CG10_big_fil_rev_8_21_14_0_10_43_11]|uniref:Glycoside hydrolase family 1 protein n=1 Tax=Candidatus Falkowbacteria bacterium CG10_big_fil_rev_8_21_14_0_10_43_11 TaxID=1974568 RepID=A0A2M6WM05_9BACT|nr:MAG: glycoside hydrolase family 1 protein [Candidatus Falkowbacteria bacterium CG10_big_fil_rev_8_21_14_0_10_43_11]
MAEHEIKYKFPAGFLWGTATSAHQIEGGNENNWTEWERKQGKIKDGSISGRACNSYELYKEDIKLAKELNNNAYRFGIEWSRIEPQRGKFDKNELRHYQKVIAECRRNRLEPFVTLYHWTQPLWFAKMGGWLNKQSPLMFRSYIEQVVRFFGSSVTFWCTLNEPMIYAYNSYWLGKWTPQEKSFFKFKKVIKNLIAAHKLAYFVLHERNSRCQVSIAKNNQCFEPYLDTWLNIMAVNFIRNYWNHSFLNKIKNELDYIGLNYYFHNLLYVSLQGYVQMNENKIISDMGWEIYPRGIYEVLKELQEYRLPIYILENGLADARDEKRADLIREHLRYAHQAITEGVDVRGYCHWSLMDNFEWADGYEPKFGLHEVDFKTFKRTARPSAKIYSEICKNNGV